MVITLILGTDSLIMAHPNDETLDFSALMITFLSTVKWLKSNIN